MYISLLVFLILPMVGSAGSGSEAATYRVVFYTPVSPVLEKWEKEEKRAECSRVSVLLKAKRTDRVQEGGKHSNQAE